MIDATNILANRLYMGGRPSPGREIYAGGFDVLVLCAEEIQLPTDHFPGVEVMYVPLHDDASQPVSEKIWAQVTGCARRVARRVRAGKRVLVTCAAGLNRSGFVVAAAVHYLTGHSGPKCCSYVSRRRVRCGKHALYNKAFVKALSDRLPNLRKAQTA